MIGLPSGIENEKKLNRAKVNILSYIPGMAIVWIIFNSIHFNSAAGIWKVVNYQFNLPSGVFIELSNGTLFILFTLMVLLYELFKSTTISNIAIVEQIFSLIAFMAFLVQFLVSKVAEEPTFIIISAISFVESLAGLVILMKVSRRDISFN